ncbi:MAG: hypothetical protein KGI91_03110 [Burkholderiales bacterium]|nr:hypothetical protein [Burkholderiales bacterium]MDE2076051.1 hypothetical protein [Burkholderiales bacterium]MDE2431430.1 hypothetical protein [Burkholderiales bacterium]
MVCLARTVTTGAATDTQAQITLQEFLTKLQSNLGYGATGSTASGSILSATA